MFFPRKYGTRRAPWNVADPMRYLAQSYVCARWRSSEEQRTLERTSKARRASHRPVSVVGGIVQNMATTEHPIVLAAERVILQAAELLEGEGFSRKEGARYGVPEAIAESAGDDTVARVVAERALILAGIDVWWSDLLCIDGDDAAETLRAASFIDPEEVYGPMWEAILGLLKACDMLSFDQLNGIANVTSKVEWDLYVQCAELAQSLGRGPLFLQVCEDVHFATAHYASTPAGVTRRLRGIRGLECIAALYVLRDVLSVEDARVLAGPVSKIIFPLSPSVR
jgi:hypothetical protein